MIGAGQMGSGIAHVARSPVSMSSCNDMSAERVKVALATINGNMARQVSKKAITEEQRQAALKRIEGAASMEDFSDTDLVIEAATEKEDIKRKIHIELCPLAEAGHDPRDQHVLALDHPACFRDRPARALHRHPFYESGAADGSRGDDPRHRDGRADIQDVRSNSSRSWKNRRGRRRIFRLSSSTVSCCRWSTRRFTRFMRASGTVEAIDLAMRLGARHPMGPLQLADFIGLDTCLSVMQVLYEGLADTNTGRARCW